MYLEQVLPALRQGERIVRRSDPNVCIQMGDGELLTFNPKDGETPATPALLTWADVTATDWQVLTYAESSQGALALDPDRPYEGYGGIYNAANLGEPEPKLDAVSGGQRYFIPMTQNEVVQVDGQWVFDDPELPPK